MLSYEDIKEEVVQEIAKDKRATRLFKDIQSGLGTYNTASEYAIRVGDCVGKVLKRHEPFENIYEWDLENLIPQVLGLDHNYVATACSYVQKTLYDDALLDIKFLEPKFDGNRAYGLVEELRSHPELLISKNILRPAYKLLAECSRRFNKNECFCSKWSWH